MKSEKYISSGGFPRAFYLFPLIHLAVAIPLAYHFNIWSDEASTLFSTKDGLLAAITNSANEKQAPLYFILLSVWRLFDSSIFFARIFSVLCSVLSIGVFFTIVRRFWNQRVAFFVTFFFSVHPFLFWASTEIRVYALVILLSLVLVSLFGKNFLHEETPRPLSSLVFVLVAVASLYTNYYLGFLLAALFAGLLVLGKFDAAKKYLIWMVVTGVLFLPMVVLTLTQGSGVLDGRVLETDTLDGVRRIWNHLLYFGLPTELYPPEDQTTISFIRLWAARLLILAAAASLFLRRRLPEQPFQLFGVVTLIVSLFLVAAFYLLGMLYVEIRHAAVLFGPITLFLTALVFEFAPKDKRRNLYPAIVGVILIIFYSYALTAMYPNWTKRGDWNRVAAFVKKNEKPGQPVVVFRNYEALAFAQSYDGNNRVLPEEKYFDWNYEGEIGTAAMWPRQLEYVISVFPEDSEHVWLATEDVCQTTPACEPLEKFVKENYTVVLRQDFYKERVRLLKKR